MVNSYSTIGQPTLAQILDVDINPATLANNNMIKYNSTTGLWDNAVIPAGATTSGLDTVLTNGNTTTQTAIFSGASSNTISDTGMTNTGAMTILAGLNIDITANDGSLILNSASGTSSLYGNDIVITAGSTFGLTAPDSLTITCANGIHLNSSVGIGTAFPNANALLEIATTTKAFLPPRMTTTQKNAIPTPVAGMVVYDSTLNKLCVRGTTAWQTITSV